MSDEIIWLTIFDRISITASPFTLHLGGCGTGGALPPRPRPTFHLCLVLCVWVFVCTQGWWSSSHVHARHRLRQKAGVEGWQVGFRSKRIIAVVNKTGGWLTMPGWPVGRQRHAVASHTPRLPPANVDNWRIVQRKKKLIVKIPRCTTVVFTCCARKTHRERVRAGERFPERRGVCWLADSDMKTRPAGIGDLNAEWMGSLPSQLSAMPLKHLAVPGEPVRKDVRIPLSVQHWMHKQQHN